MDHHKLVLPEHMNDQGALFGGYLLKWLDEYAYIMVNIDYPNRNFLTIALENVVFKKPIACGQILRFAVNESKMGNTSVEYHVDVFGEKGSENQTNPLFQTNITFVSVDEDGNKKSIIN
ncbi:MAG: acyl-CoA thioesterase [Planctomycetota bacterium]|nr:MAG: acyl-CoA thioesterase [Planctomycetota bacterium]